MLNFILLPLFFIAHSSEQKNDWEKSNLRGNPEKVVTIKEKSLPVTEIFNKSGFIIHKINECFCGCPQDKECKVDYVYSKDNKLMETTTTVENKVVEKIAYSYKSDGILDGVKYIIGGDLTEEVAMSQYGLETEMKYDKYKNLTEEIITNTENSTKQITKYNYKYDKKGNWLIKETSMKDFKETDFHKVNVIKREITYF